MADIGWIKLCTDIFENDKIVTIRRTEPRPDTVILTWIGLLCAAGRLNTGGVFESNGKPYSPDTIAGLLHRTPSSVRRALGLFERMGMISADRGVVSITNWAKYQNVEGLERIREQNRERKKKQRERANGTVGATPKSGGIHIMT